MESPDIDTYIKEAELIEKMYMDLLEGTTRKMMKRIDDGSTGLQNVEYRICVINSMNELLQSALLQKYGEWYEVCRELIQKYTGKGRKIKDEDFTGLYDKIVSLINLKDSTRNSNERKHLKSEFIACFDAQVSMLHAVEPLVTSGRNDLKRLAIAEMMNSELEYAEKLYVQGSAHLAGISAINALEIYLNALCEESGIESEPQDTLFEIAQKLHECGKVHDFDQDMLRTIEQLAALSSKCANPDEELKDDEISELINKIREITFLAFF